MVGYSIYIDFLSTPNIEFQYEDDFRDFENLKFVCREGG